MKRLFARGAVVGMMLAASQAVVAQTAPATAPAPAIPGDTVMATVDGKPITHADVRAFHASLPPQYRQIALENILPQLIERLIDQRLGAAAARTSGLAGEPEVMQRLAMLQEGFLNQVYIEKHLSEMVSEERVREAYRKAIALEPKREEIHARHILVKTEAEAVALIVEIQGGADFAELARKKSTGPSARSGGDLGFFGEGQMVPAFSAAAFALQPGEVTKKPVKTQFGWHVIKVEERRVAGQQDFEQARAKLQQQMTEQAYDKLMSDLRAKAKIDLKTPGGGGIKPLQ